MKIEILGRASRYDNMNRDALIDTYIEYMDEDERYDLLFELIKENDARCYEAGWLRRVLEDIDKEDAE